MHSDTEKVRKLTRRINCEKRIAVQSHNENGGTESEKLQICFVLNRKENKPSTKLKNREVHINRQP